MANQQGISFGPFRRYISTIEPHLLPQDAISSGLNMLVDPVAGGFFKRSGSTIVGGDTVTALKRATTGIMESKPGWVPCRLREFFSPAILDGVGGGYPTYSVLYRRDPTSTSWPTIDDGVFGTEYVRKGSFNYNLLNEFSSTYYPTGGGAMGDQVYFRVTPWWYESGEGGYSRGATEFTRRFCTSGSWSTVDAGKWRYYPNLRATPMEWDGGCNANSSGNALTFRPTGPFSPLWMPTITANTSGEGSLTATTAASPFLSGHTFWYSVIFQMDDGSYTLPTIPREINTNLTSGYGLAVIGTPAADGARTGYKSLTFANVPIGPSGTRARVILRSNIQLRATSTAPITVSITPAADGTGGLQIMSVIDNNTQTSVTVTTSVDDSLVQNADVIRYDLICPPRSRYYGTGDNRLIGGYTLPSPNAIQLTCIGMTTAYDMNLAQDSVALTGSTSAVYKVTTTGLVIAKATGGTVDASLTIDWATYPTLQDVVDKVNSTSDVGAGAHYGQWRAQLAPGADPSAESSKLCPTVWTSSSSTSAASTSLTVDATTLAAVPLGYKVYDSAGKIAAGTYVVSKTASALVLSAAASGAGSAAALDFFPDTGDTSCVTTAGSNGWIRAIGHHIPGMIYFRRTKMPGYDQPAKNRIYFTTSSPGAAATGVSLAPRAWVRSNRRDGKSFSGQVMGIVDVNSAAVILYRDRKALFINERGNNTGEDFDMRLQTIDDSRGCVSPWSVVGVNGAAVFASPIGIEAMDKSKRVVKLSSDVYEPVRGRGDLGYEIGQCVARAAQDSPNCWLGAVVWGHRLVLSYRPDTTTYAMIAYDFSAGVDTGGVESLADPSARAPYGWSTPLILDTTNYQFGPRAMGVVNNGSGQVLYGAMNDNNGSTGDGRVDVLFTGALDNGVQIYGYATSAARLAQPGTRVSNQNATVVHKITYSGVIVYVSRVQSGASGFVTLATAGTSDQKRERKQIKQADRSPGDRCQVTFSDDTTSTGGLVWGVDVESEVLAWRGGD